MTRTMHLLSLKLVAACLLGQILAVLADQNVNVLDMINKSRNDVAYNLIDLESAPSEESVAAIAAINNVIKVTVI